MDLKEGMKRIFLAIGYLIFILLGYIATLEENIYTVIFGCAAGFFAFKGILFGINWIIAGFKENKE